MSKRTKGETITIIWHDVRKVKSHDSCDMEAELHGHKARVWALPRTGNGKAYAAEAGDVTTEHRTFELARKAADKRLIDASRKGPAVVWTDDFEIRTHLGQRGHYRARYLGEGQGHQVEFRPANGGLLRFTAIMFSRGTEEDSVRMDLDEQHATPGERMKWATWRTEDGALFTFERLDHQEAA